MLTTSTGCQILSGGARIAPAGKHLIAFGYPQKQLEQPFGMFFLPDWPSPSKISNMNQSFFPGLAGKVGISIPHLDFPRQRQWDFFFGYSNLHRIRPWRYFFFLGGVFLVQLRIAHRPAAAHWPAKKPARRRRRDGPPLLDAQAASNVKVNVVAAS